MKSAVVALGNSAFVGPVCGLGLGDDTLFQLAPLAAAPLGVGEDGGVGVGGLHRAAGLVYSLDLPACDVGLPTTTRIPLLGHLPGLKARLSG